MENPALPTIYGDDIHDDTAGLQAFFDGEPVLVAGDSVPVVCRAADGSAVLREGAFRLTDIITFGGATKAQALAGEPAPSVLLLNVPEV